MSVSDLRDRVRAIGKSHSDREARARRIFLLEGAKALEAERETEFDVKSAVAEFFGVRFSAVAFCGSAQLGFSAIKGTEFVKGRSDLDVAIIHTDLFQAAWENVVSSTRAFSDLTPFGRRGRDEIATFKKQILGRGMIRVKMMPISDLSREWRDFEDKISRDHSRTFSGISFAIYISEYAFCWKQDSALQAILR